MVLGWDLEHEGDGRRDNTTTYTSYELLEEATYPVMMNELIDSRAFRSDPIVNGLFVNKGQSEERNREVKGRPYQAPQARTRPIDPATVKSAEEPTALVKAETDAPATTTETVQLATGPEPEITLSVHDSLETPEVKVIGHIDLPEHKPALVLGEELHDGLVRGQINALKAGFGFIDVGVKENAFFHYKSLNGINFNDLLVGDIVEARLSRSEKDQLVASDVALLEE